MNWSKAAVILGLAASGVYLYIMWKKCRCALPSFLSPRASIGGVHCVPVVKPHAECHAPTISRIASPDTILICQSSGIRTNQQAITNAQIIASGPIGLATLPAIGQQPNDNAQWSNVAQNDGTWLWQSIDGSNLVFASDSAGRRVR